MTQESPVGRILREEGTSESPESSNTSGAAGQKQKELTPEEKRAGVLGEVLKTEGRKLPPRVHDILAAAHKGEDAMGKPFSVGKDLMEGGYAKQLPNPEQEDAITKLSGQLTTSGQDDSLTFDQLFQNALSGMPLVELKALSALGSRLEHDRKILEVQHGDKAEDAEEAPQRVRLGEMMQWAAKVGWWCQESHSVGWAGHMSPDEFKEASAKEAAELRNFLRDAKDLPSQFVALMRGMLSSEGFDLRALRQGNPILDGATLAQSREVVPITPEMQLKRVADELVTKHGLRPRRGNEHGTIYYHDQNTRYEFVSMENGVVNVIKVDKEGKPKGEPEQYPAGAFLLSIREREQELRRAGKLEKEKKFADYAPTPPQAGVLAKASGWGMLLSAPGRQMLWNGFTNLFSSHGREEIVKDIRKHKISYIGWGLAAVGVVSTAGAGAVALPFLAPVLYAIRKYEEGIWEQRDRPTIGHH